MKDTLYDRNESKLIDKVCQLRETNPNLKVGEMKRPDCTPGFTGMVFEVEIEY